MTDQDTCPKCGAEFDYLNNRVATYKCGSYMSSAGYLMESNQCLRNQLATIKAAVRGYVELHDSIKTNLPGKESPQMYILRKALGDKESEDGDF